ncbi:MAG: hypothetical protein GY929_13285 [Actinomycetia bacterium]|nr:hypothetical protein [Actinomycetes bacterium]
MRRSVLSAGLGLTLTGLLAVPALAAPAADSGSDSAWASADSGSLAGRSHDRLVVVPRRPEDPSDRRPVDGRPDRPHDALEELRMACHGRTNDEGRAAVGCQWSPTELERAAGYRLERADGDAREVIFRTDDVTQTTFVDSEIRPGQRYRYRVIVVNADGRTIGVGGPVTAGVEADRDMERLHLVCEAGEDGSVVGCKWEPARSHDVAGYQLWRAVDRDGRQLVYRGGPEITSYVDDDLRGAKVVHYAVVAVDADGEMIGRSGAVTIRFIDEPGTGPIVDVKPVDRPIPVSPDEVGPPESVQD